MKTDDELRAAIDGVWTDPDSPYRHGPMPGAAPARHPPGWNDPLPSGWDEVPPADEAPGKKPTGSARPLRWLWADDVRIDLDEIDLVAELLPTEGLTVEYGPSGCGKTFLSVDLACHVAAGRPWYERAVTAGPVIYVAAEAPASVEKRVTAWKWRHEVTRLDLAIVQSSVDLLSGDAEAIVAVGKSIEAERGRVALVVIDTLARAMVGNENAPEDMGAFVAGCGAIREALNCHVLVVHHCGKDEARGARGHSSLRAATDIELEVAEGEDGIRTAKVTKHRDEASGGVFAFKLDVVELGVNRHGRTVTTCVAAETDAPTGHARDARQERPLSAVGKIALDGLLKAVIAVGAKPPAHDETQGVLRAVTLDQWRTYFRQVGGFTEDEAKGSSFRMSWKRGREAAIGRGKAKVWGDFAWLASKGQRS